MRHEFERDLASERTKAALAHKARKMERTGDLAYGYVMAEDGVHLIPAPDEQRVLAMIRQWHAADWSLREIASELTSQGIPTKKGNGEWSHQSVGKIVARIEERGQMGRAG